MEDKGVTITHLKNAVSKDEKTTKLNKLLFLIEKNSIYPININENLVDVRKCKNVNQSDIDYIIDIGYEVIFNE